MRLDYVSEIMYDDLSHRELQRKRKWKHDMVIVGKFTHYDMVDPDVDFQGAVSSVCSAIGGCLFRFSARSRVRVGMLLW